MWFSLIQNHIGKNLHLALYKMYIDPKHWWQEEHRVWIPIQSDPGLFHRIRFLKFWFTGSSRKSTRTLGDYWWYFIIFNRLPPEEYKELSEDNLDGSSECKYRYFIKLNGPLSTFRLRGMRGDRFTHGRYQCYWTGKVTKWNMKWEPKWYRLQIPTDMPIDQSINETKFLIFCILNGWHYPVVSKV